VAVVIYAVTLLAAGLGMFMMVTRNGESLIIFFCIVVLLFLIFDVVGSVRLKDTIAGLQRKHDITKQVQEEIRSFEEAQLAFRSAHTFDNWLSAVCEAAKQLDFAWLSLKIAKKDGSIDTQVWRIAEGQPDLSDIITMTIPLRDHDEVGPIEFEIAVLVNGSYESAGRRATLFNRLIDEHSTAILSHD
jgi:hypothetical protein